MLCIIAHISVEIHTYMSGKRKTDEEGGGERESTNELLSDASAATHTNICSCSSSYSVREGHLATVFDVSAAAAAAAVTQVSTSKVYMVFIIVQYKYIYFFFIV